MVDVISGRSDIVVSVRLMGLNRSEWRDITGDDKTAFIGILSALFLQYEQFGLFYTFLCIFGGLCPCE